MNIGTVAANRANSDVFINVFMHAGMYSLVRILSAMNHCKSINLILQR